VAALTIPSQRIDGDFYVFLRHSNESLDVIVGDVMGKGVPAALLGAATKSHFLRALSDLMVLAKDRKLPEPKEIVMLAHAELVRHLIDLDSFVTLCYARFDMGRRSLDLVDCGHTGVVHLHGKTGLHEIKTVDSIVKTIMTSLVAAASMPNIQRRAPRIVVGILATVLCRD
jgi:sigma-B regulation protein RsbU (phosphoserine phosphatase)